VTWGVGRKGRRQKYGNKYGHNNLDGVDDWNDGWMHKLLGGDDVLHPTQILDVEMERLVVLGDVRRGALTYQLLAGRKARRKNKFRLGDDFA
jgi:hypothetical protein